MATSIAAVHSFPAHARVVIGLRGPDTLRFLQGTLTAAVDPLPTDTAIPAGLLTVKGKLISDAIVVAAEDGADLLVPMNIGVDVAELLERHIIMDDVEVAPVRPAVFAVAWGDPIDPPAGVRVLACRHPAAGQLLLATDDSVLTAVKGTWVDENAWNRHRVVTASPAWGAELEAGHFPPEVGFVAAVSYDKGCYMGQEPLARIHARGQVNWVMVRVSLPQTVEVPAALSHPEREQAGRLTTCVAEPAEGLAIVRREYAVPDQRLQAGDVEVTITSGPLGDDPGIGRTSTSPVKLGRR